MDKVYLKLTKCDRAAHSEHHIINLDLVAPDEGGKLNLTIPAARAML